jgi:hypothetical protein
VIFDIQNLAMDDATLDDSLLADFWHLLVQHSLIFGIR